MNFENYKNHLISNGYRISLFNGIYKNVTYLGYICEDRNTVFIEERTLNTQDIKNLLFDDFNFTIYIGSNLDIKNVLDNLFMFNIKQLEILVLSNTFDLDYDIYDELEEKLEIYRNITSCVYKLEK